MPLADLLARLRADPPHRVLGRLLSTGLRTGLVTAAARHPIALARVALRHGLSVRSLHRLYAALDPHGLAWIDHRRSLTWAQADADLDAFAAALVGELGARRGRPVALALANSVEYLTGWFALARLGIAAAHLSRYATAAELAPLLAIARPSVIVVDGNTWPAVEEGLAGLEDPPRVVGVGDGPFPDRVIPFDALLERYRDRRPVTGRAAAAENVIYTSGTTGRPKGAVRDLSSAGALEGSRIIERLPVHAGDRHLLVAPLYHAGGQAFCLLASALGAAIVVHEDFDAARCLQALAHDAIDHVFLVPTMTQRILDLPAQLHAQCPTPTLRAIVSGAAAFPDALRRRAIARFGPECIFDFYGATELGWVTLADGHEMLARPSTVGRPIAGQRVRILDDHGRDVARGEIGKIYTRSAQLMRGYLHDRRATEATSHEGWITVDDLGRIDDDGYLFLTGRARDMVITGGVNVYPLEVEHALSLHPGIADVAVVGIADEQWGERLVAVVVAAPGFDPEEATRWARQRLAPYKVPRRWVCVDELPRNPTGKVLKQRLRDDLADPGTPGV